MTLIRFVVKWAKIYWYRLLRLISRHTRRNHNLWVFGARDGRRYDENTKYLYEYMNSREPDIHAVWLTREPAIRRALKKKTWMRVCATVPAVISHK